MLNQSGGGGGGGGEENKSSSGLVGIDNVFLHRSISAPPVTDRNYDSFFQTQSSHSSVQTGQPLNLNSTGGNSVHSHYMNNGQVSSEDNYYYYSSVPHNLNPRQPKHTVIQQQHLHSQNQNQSQNQQGGNNTSGVAVSSSGKQQQKISEDIFSSNQFFPQPSKPASSILSYLDEDSHSPNAKSHSHSHSHQQQHRQQKSYDESNNSSSSFQHDSYTQSAHDLKLSKSVFDQIQEDFPRTPSPVFAHLNGLSSIPTLASLKQQQHATAESAAAAAALQHQQQQQQQQQQHLHNARHHQQHHHQSHTSGYPNYRDASAVRTLGSDDILLEPNSTSLRGSHHQHSHSMQTPVSPRQQPSTDYHSSLLQGPAVNVSNVKSHHGNLDMLTSAVQGMSINGNNMQMVSSAKENIGSSSKQQHILHDQISLQQQHESAVLTDNQAAAFRAVEIDHQSQLARGGRLVYAVDSRYAGQQPYHIQQVQPMIIPAGVGVTEQLYYRVAAAPPQNHVNHVNVNHVNPSGYRQEVLYTTSQRPHESAYVSNAASDGHGHATSHAHSHRLQPTEYISVIPMAGPAGQSAQVFWDPRMIPATNVAAVPNREVGVGVGAAQVNGPRAVFATYPSQTPHIATQQASLSSASDGGVGTYVSHPRNIQQQQQQQDRDISSSHAELNSRPSGKSMKQENREDNRGGGNRGDKSSTRGNHNSGGVSSSRGASALEEFKNNAKGRLWDIQDIVGSIVLFCQDQHGSRFIQTKLENADETEKNMICQEILPYAQSLMTDVFGNYVIQKVLEHGNQDQREKLADIFAGEAVQLALQMYGCRVIQKALEVIDSARLINLVKEFDTHVLKCVHDQNGNHVIQKCIEVVSNSARDAETEQEARYLVSQIQFIVDAFNGQVQRFSMHPYGCRVIQRILEHCTGVQKDSILDEIIINIQSLIQDQYGNYVIQHVLKHGRPHDRRQVLDEVKSKMLAYSQHKFASNVVEKCLVHGTDSEKNEIVDEIIRSASVSERSSSALLLMMRDPYGNYVVQKMLDIASDAQKDTLGAYLKQHAQQLKRYTYGKHILARLEKLSGEKLM